jgi:prepilin-type N-terminal cleavage/methylation domain-containing protein
MLRFKKHHKHRGFTLLEMLLSVALMAVISGIGTPIYQSFQNRNDLDIAANSVVQSIRRAQMLSQAGAGDSTWGVHVESGSITLFRGTSYASRSTDVDEVFSMPTAIVSSGISDVVFDVLTGEPQTTGTLTLTSQANEIRTITINEKGMVTF